MNKAAVNKRLDALESEMNAKQRAWGVAFQRDGFIEFQGACYVRNDDLPKEDYENFIIVHWVESDGNGKPKKVEPKDYGDTFRGRLRKAAC